MICQKVFAPLLVHSKLGWIQKKRESLQLEATVWRLGLFVPEPCCNFLRGNSRDGDVPRNVSMIWSTSISGRDYLRYRRTVAASLQLLLLKPPFTICMLLSKMIQSSLFQSWGFNCSPISLKVGLISCNSVSSAHSAWGREPYEGSRNGIKQEKLWRFTLGSCYFWL
jgi:hypothetical protein